MSRICRILAVCSVCAYGPCLAASEENTAPTVNRLTTRWAEAVTPETAWQTYPRPQLVRKDWLCLNGLWDYAVAGAAAWKGGRVANAAFDPLLDPAVHPPDTWDGKILVPYAIESTLSGVQKLVRPGQTLWYRRAFEIPAAWRDRRVRLNFEAVDWHAAVWVNGTRAGDNRGGYVPFSIDITEALREENRQELVVGVWDPTNAGGQSIGKQALPEMKKGFRYEPTTGIWQSVWLEPVPETHIAHLGLIPQKDVRSVSARADVLGDLAGASVEFRVLFEDQVVCRGNSAPGTALVLKVPDARCWSPESPTLYGLEAVLKRDDHVLDRVRSYFGLRRIELKADAKGVQRIHLNGKPIFQFGPLDQGYWPDGGLTPPSDEAARFDVQYLKDIGCNMVRVHMKTHPARWYYWCDRLGLLVWQDFVCTRKFEPRLTKASKRQWETEQRRMIDHLRNHPCIVQWTIFNEGWGQYATARLTRWTEKCDPSRLVASFSGWTDTGAGRIHDAHDYSYFVSPPWPPKQPGRACVLGECGGFNVAVPGHTWYTGAAPTMTDNLSEEKGRNHYPSGEAWLPRYRQWLNTLRALYFHGINAAVYTQLTDIEHELNGWLTYDREISKIPAAVLKPLHQRLLTMPEATLAAKNARLCCTKRIPEDKAWLAPEFDDTSWTALPAPVLHPATEKPLSEGPAAFRLTFALDALPAAPAVRVIGNGAVEVFLNGRLVQRAKNDSKAPRTRAPQRATPAEPPVTFSIINLHDGLRKVLRRGSNVLAVKYDGPALYGLGVLGVPP